MKYTQLFEDFINEGKSFEFSFNYNTDEDDVEYVQNILHDAGVDAIAEPGIDSEEMMVKAKNAVELRKAKKAIQADGFEVNESEVNEGINVKDIKVGTILNFKDGETWKVTKTSGISSGKIFAAPYGETKKSYVSLPIEFSIENLENDVKSLNESQTFNEFLNESEVNEAYDSYHDIYIAKERFDMKIGKKTWDIAEGSVFGAAGGGWWRDANYDITKLQCGIDDIQNHAQYF